MKIVEASAKLLSITPNATELIEYCGRICYKTEDREIDIASADKFIKMLIKRGHHSVLEHASATFHIVCDRGISHEIVRHRLASYSQTSTRYCNYAKGKFGHEITVIKPSELEAAETWTHSCVEAELAYFKLLAEGEKAEIARSLLPTCLKTELAMTANFREWRHFLDLRLKGNTGKPHPDIKKIAHQIWLVLSSSYPAVFSDL